MTATTQEPTLDALTAKARAARQRAQELERLLMLNRQRARALISEAHEILRANRRRRAQA